MNCAVDPKQGESQGAGSLAAPFELDGQQYQSVESFWQGLKFADEADRRWRWTRFVGAAMRSRLASLTELQDGKGDGVVSVESGKLDGVEDVILLHFHHNEPLWDADDEAVKQLHEEVLKRLAK